MANNLILKIKKNTSDKGQKDYLMVKTKDKEWFVYYTEYVSTAVGGALMMMDYDYEVSLEFLRLNTVLANLRELIAQDFIIKLDENGKEFGLTISKRNCETRFNVNKKDGIASLFIQAEEWATEMLEEINNNNSL